MDQSIQKRNVHGWELHRCRLVLQLISDALLPGRDYIARYAPFVSRTTLQLSMRDILYPSSSPVHTYFANTALDEQQPQGPVAYLPKLPAPVQRLMFGARLLDLEL